MHLTPIPQSIKQWTISVVAGLAFTIIISLLVRSGSVDILLVALTAIVFAVIFVIEWKLLILVVYPIVWAWTWVPILPGVSIERVLGIPAIIGFVLFEIMQRREQKALPFGSSKILLVLAGILLVGIALNPTANGVGRFLTVIQKIVWSYLVFAVLIKSTEKELSRFVKLLILSTVLAALGGLLVVNEFGLSTRYTNIIEGEWRLISYGIIGLNITAPVVFFLFAVGNYRSSTVWKITSYILFGIIVLGTVLTIARRETIIVIPIGLLAISLFADFKYRMRALVTLVCGILVFFVYVLPSSPIWQGRFYEDLLERTVTVEEPRAALAISGWNAFLDRPIFGYGTGSASIILQLQAEDLDLEVPNSSHNSFISMMIETGIFGLGTIIILWLSIFYGLWSSLQIKITSPYLQQLVYTLPGVISYAFLRWFTGDAMRNNPTWTLLGLCWAIIWLAHNHKSQSTSQAPSTPE